MDESGCFSKSVSAKGLAIKGRKSKGGKNKSKELLLLYLSVLVVEK